MLLLAISALQACKSSTSSLQLSPHTFTILLSLDSRWLSQTNKESLTLLEQKPDDEKIKKLWTSINTKHIKELKCLDFKGFEDFSTVLFEHQESAPHSLEERKTPQGLHDKAKTEIGFLRAVSAAIDHTISETTAVQGIKNISASFKQFLMMTMLDSLAEKICTSEKWQDNVIDGLQCAITEFDSILIELETYIKIKGIPSRSSGVVFDNTFESPYILLQTQHLKERIQQLTQDNFVSHGLSQTDTDEDQESSYTKQGYLFKHTTATAKQIVYRRTMELLCLSLLIKQNEAIWALLRKPNVQEMLPGCDKLAYTFSSLNQQLASITIELFSQNNTISNSRCDYLSFLANLLYTKYLLQNSAKLYVLIEANHYPGYFHWRNSNAIVHEQTYSKLEEKINNIASLGLNSEPRLEPLQEMFEITHALLGSCMDALSAVCKNYHGKQSYHRTITQLINPPLPEEWRNGDNQTLEMKERSGEDHPAAKGNKKTKTKMTKKAKEQIKKTVRFFESYLYLKKAEERFEESPAFNINDLEYADLDTPISFLFRIPKQISHSLSTITSIKGTEQELRECTLDDISDFIRKVRPIKGSKNQMDPSKITRTNDDKKPIEPLPEANSFICTYEHAKSLQTLQLYALRALELELINSSLELPASNQLKRAVKELVTEAVTFDESNQRRNAKEYQITTPFHIVRSLVRCMHVPDAEKQQALDELLTYKAVGNTHPFTEIQHVKQIFETYSKNADDNLNAWSLCYLAIAKYRHWLRKLITSRYFQKELSHNKESLTLLYEAYSLPLLPKAQQSAFTSHLKPSYSTVTSSSPNSESVYSSTAPEDLEQPLQPLLDRRDGKGEKVSLLSQSIEPQNGEYDSKRVDSTLEDMLKRLQHDFNNATGAHLAKKIIKNNEHQLLRHGEKMMLEAMQDTSAIDIFEQILAALKTELHDNPEEFDRHLAQSIEILKAWNNPGIIDALQKFKDNSTKRIEDMSNYTLPALLTGMVANALYLKSESESYTFVDGIAEKTMKMTNFIDHSKATHFPSVISHDIPDFAHFSDTKKSFVSFISEMDKMLNSLNPGVQAKLYYNPGQANQYRATPGANGLGLIPGNIVTTTFLSIFGIVSVMTGIKPQEKVTHVLELSEKLLLILGRLPASNIEDTLSKFLDCPVDEIYSGTRTEKCLDCLSGTARINHCFQSACAGVINTWANIGCACCKGLYKGLEGCKGYGPLPCARSLLQNLCGGTSILCNGLKKTGHESILHCGKTCCNTPSAACSMLEGCGSCCGACAKGYSATAPLCCKYQPDSFKADPLSMCQRFFSHTLTFNWLFPCLCSPFARCVPNQAHSYKDALRYRTEASTTRIVHGMFKFYYYDLLKPTIDCTVRNIFNLVEGIYLLLTDFEIATSFKTAIVDDMRACDYHFDIHEALANLGETGGETINKVNYEALERVYGTKAVRRLFKTAVSASQPEPTYVEKKKTARNTFTALSLQPQKTTQRGIVVQPSPLNISSIEDAKWCCGKCDNKDKCRAIFCQTCGAILNITAWGVEAYNKLKYIVGPCLNVNKSLGGILRRSLCCKGKENLSREEAINLLNTKVNEGALPKDDYTELVNQLDKLEPPYSEQVLSILELKINRDKTDKFFCGCKMPQCFGITIPAKMVITALSKGADNLGQIFTICGERAELHRRGINTTIVAEGTAGSWKDMLTGASNRAAIIIGNKVMQTLSGSLDSIDTPIKEQIVGYFQDKDLTMLPPAMFNFVVKLTEMSLPERGIPMKENPVAAQVDRISKKAQLALALGHDGLNSITRFLKAEVEEHDKTFVKKKERERKQLKESTCSDNSIKQLIYSLKTFLPVSGEDTAKNDDFSDLSPTEKAHNIIKLIRNKKRFLNSVSAEHADSASHSAEAIIATLEQSMKYLITELADHKSIYTAVASTLNYSKPILRNELASRLVKPEKFSEYLHAKQAFFHEKTKGFIYAPHVQSTATAGPDSIIPTVSEQATLQIEGTASPASTPKRVIRAVSIDQTSQQSSVSTANASDSSASNTAALGIAENSTIASLSASSPSANIHEDCRRTQFDLHLNQAIAIFEGHDPWEVKVTELFKEIKAIAEFEDLFFDVFTDTKVLKILRDNIPFPNPATSCTQEARLESGSTPLAPTSHILIRH